MRRARDTSTWASSQASGPVISASKFLPPTCALQGAHDRNVAGADSVAMAKEAEFGEVSRLGCCGFAEPDADGIAVDAHRINRERGYARLPDRLAARDVEGAAMHWAFDQRAVDIAFGQERMAVRT